LEREEFLIQAGVKYSLPRYFLRSQTSAGRSQTMWQPEVEGRLFKDWLGV